MMKKFLILFFLCFFSQITNAQVRVGHLFVMISDAMENAKNSNEIESIPILENFKAEFDAIPTPSSQSRMQVNETLEIALKNPKLENLESLSVALLAFEKEQNPVDYEAKRKQFEKRVIPVFKQFERATEEKNIEELPLLYKRLYDTWQRNERVVGDTSAGHYGQIETALALYRVAMVSEVPDFDAMNLQLQKLGSALNDFIKGNVLEAQSVEGAPQNLLDGLALLRRALADFPENESIAKDAIFTFITQWPIFEGEVRTRDGGLYNRIESELPEIAAKGASKENLERFLNLIESIEALDISAGYTAFDAAIILLREGLEALLIIMALLASLQAANQARGQYWVIGGAILGIGFSLIVAIILAQVFPLAAASTNREILEGAVGIVAVVVMIFVGAWLHSKSSIAGWQSYISSKMGQALAQGSLFGLSGLAFLAVFREGAETILFYAGMMPQITMESFLSGVGAAILGLIVIAYLMKIFAQKLPIHLMFKVMSWLIYALGFKILGVSVHALQLTNVLSQDILPLPSIVILGFYNSLQGMLAQIVYIVLVIVVAIWQRRIEMREK
ncbi:FTR1 family protein [Helicobacter sp.]|uniref:FTR1 family iron permease n=1 Tax=Helicobacter sp. TaxID=218 RepID=UPI0025C0C866|nr:FTR1 family protein [Helicobacter sp.]